MNRKENLKERLKKGEQVLGSFLTIPSPSVVNAAGLSGLDFVIIDCEHGAIEIGVAEDMVRAADVSGAASIIRVPVNQSEWILRALDIGSTGIQVPHVSTRADAQRVVDSAKYCPEGSRGYTPFTRAGGYGLNGAKHAEMTNAKTVVVVNVEGLEGLKNLEEIAQVKGVDVIFIGPYDLSHALRKPGQVDHPDIIKGIKKCVKIAKAKGLACGSFARDLNYLDILVECGVQYLTYMVDSALILQSYQNIVQRMKKR